MVNKFWHCLIFGILNLFVQMPVGASDVEIQLEMRPKFDIHVEERWANPDIEGQSKLEELEKRGHDQILGITITNKSTEPLKVGATDVSLIIKDAQKKTRGLPFLGASCVFFKTLKPSEKCTFQVPVEQFLGGHFEAGEYELSATYSNSEVGKELARSNTLKISKVSHSEKIFVTVPSILIPAVHVAYIKDGLLYYKLESVDLNDGEQLPWNWHLHTLADKLDLPRECAGWNRASDTPEMYTVLQYWNKSKLSELKLRNLWESRYLWTSVPLTEIDGLPAVANKIDILCDGNDRAYIAVEGECKTSLLPAPVYDEHRFEMLQSVTGAGLKEKPYPVIEAQDGILLKSSCLADKPGAAIFWSAKTTKLWMLRFDSEGARNVSIRGTFQKRPDLQIIWKKDGKPSVVNVEGGNTRILELQGE